MNSLKLLSIFSIFLCVHTASAQMMQLESSFNDMQDVASAAEAFPQVVGTEYDLDELPHYSTDEWDYSKKTFSTDLKNAEQYVAGTTINNNVFANGSVITHVSKSLSDHGFVDITIQTWTTKHAGYKIVPTAIAGIAAILAATTLGPS